MADSFGASIDCESAAQQAMMELFVEGVRADPVENLQMRLLILLALAQWVTDTENFTDAGAAMMEVAYAADAGML